MIWPAAAVAWRRRHAAGTGGAVCWAGGLCGKATRHDAGRGAEAARLRLSRRLPKHCPPTHVGCRPFAAHIDALPLQQRPQLRRRQREQRAVGVFQLSQVGQNLLSLEEVWRIEAENAEKLEAAPHTCNTGWGPAREVISHAGLHAPKPTGEPHQPSRLPLPWSNGAP